MIFPPKLLSSEEVLNRNKTQTPVTSMRLNKRRTETGIFFNDLTFRMYETLKYMTVI